ncbi:nuclear transport factor 2 family protein [Pelagibius sp. Alg239-R121]|uniref:nuclear transport factor 2 family protein n=1 Tax=Pelagibius sp. Alg239-R121 TaxID=2993448 RepID=UPI0024A6B06A|nr:nuclear transport factor 2 family protein [Pelagibius sp. Alg239-R121]
MHTKNNTRQRAHDLVTNLYRTVDSRNVAALSKFLSDDVVFQLGNHEPIRGRDAVLTANAAFFKTINGMAHTIEGVWAQDRDVICSGYVQYIRSDGTELSLPFSTILSLEDGLIADYQVYADISPL